MKDYIKLMRVKHYIKNFIIFLPLLFSGKLFNISNFLNTFLSFIIFSITASSIYIINDIKDKNKDVNHPKKKKRPIASGKISIKNAIIFLIILIIINITAIIFSKMNIKSLCLLLLYFVLNILYSIKLKNYPIIDIVILASGFVIRLLFGASILDIEVSNWLLLTILTISFYMGLGKRRNEINSNKKNTRTVLKFYTNNFLDKNMYMFLAITIVFYSLWSTDPLMVEKTNNLLVWTVPMIMVLCMMYSLDIEKESDGDPIEVILSDKKLIFVSLLYALSIITIIYLL